MIEIRNVSKSFIQQKTVFKALDNVSLKVEQGDVTGIIGFSGAGKSTLIRTVNLLERPDQGKIFIQGRDLTEASGRELAAERKKIGMIFQHFNLLSSRTVSGNIALPLELEKNSPATIKQRVQELLEVVGLEDKADHYPKSLSGGQKQRVAIARALANHPHVLLCDEATSALDPVTTQSILQLLREINQRLNITILLITHEMDVVKAICNQVAVIDKGRLVAHGPLEAVLSNTKNPILEPFINAENVNIPSSLSSRLIRQPRAGLFPLVEVELNGNISFEHLLSLIYSQWKIPYKLIAAEIEYLGGANFGKVLLQLQGSSAETENVLQYFQRHHIKNSIKGYVD